MKSENEKREWQMARWLETIAPKETLHFMVNVFENSTPWNLVESPPSFNFDKNWAYNFALQGKEAQKCVFDWLTLHFATAKNQGKYKVFLAYRSENDLFSFFGLGEINLHSENAKKLFSTFEIISTCQKNAGYWPPAMAGGALLTPPFLIKNPWQTPKG